MITSKDFDFFLNNGFTPGLNPGSSMNILLNKFGDDNWYVKDVESNGLVYGIIKIGFVEFHVYNEKISGISYRPDIPYSKKDFKRQSIPWILKNREISKVESILSYKSIGYERININGPLRYFRTAGAVFGGLEKEEYTYIDTIGGVTFAFEINKTTRQLEANHICKYYDIKPIPTIKGH